MILNNLKFKESLLFCQELNQELDFGVGTRSDTRLSQILDQEPKTFPGTRSSSSGSKLSTLPTYDECKKVYYLMLFLKLPITFSKKLFKKKI